ncbi:MAG: nuclear transport factor 2 family protein [Paracoccaceae bacterium]|nr:hypothetical protein [Marinovum sp.]MDG2295236.1 nuclear transport factor 2 family protein [Paracoccaceae bacterium]|tara:strand:- start:1875 stop:2207 length:333 start_codon:yes stop_codon:yes gene_type:complete
MLYEKMFNAWDSLDVETFLSCFHEEYEFIWHSTGKVTNLQNTDWDRLAALMSASDIESRRCIYENDDIMIAHSIATYANGSRDAVMAVYLKKDGLIFKQETGATPLSAKE